MTGDMYPTDGNHFEQPVSKLSKVDAKNYGFNWIKLKSTVCLHAQLNPIKAIVRLCSSIGQLQLSEYTWW